MAVKKTTKKKIDLEKKVDEVKDVAKETAKKVEVHSKNFFSKIGDWWIKSTWEERIYMILGIILLIIGAYILRTILVGLLIIIIGYLFVSGYFVSKKK
ncbi:MAG TPA: hypothetical protein PLP73_03595 [Candidatus Absconditabacterales bacterium]|nr:hypothetical protein [Candidatus Absconditabacterales bacterium]HRU50381.1 hypothetical protein [Candidatus Absconditabacterales bacterium]